MGKTVKLSIANSVNLGFTPDPERIQSSKVEKKYIFTEEIMYYSFPFHPLLLAKRSL